MTTLDRDIKVFADQCVLLRSMYLHSETLFGNASPDDYRMMKNAAPTLFGDLSLVLHQHVILQVCNITDPAMTGKSENLSVDFLMRHYDMSNDPRGKLKLKTLRDRMIEFRGNILPVRNKYISHYDRQSLHDGPELGGTTDNEWRKFWSDLQDFVLILHSRFAGEELYINNVGELSDAQLLLKALKQSYCFELLMNSGDPALRGHLTVCSKLHVKRRARRTLRERHGVVAVRQRGGWCSSRNHR